MSVEDRDKWDARYAAGAYAERTRPSALLVQALADYTLPPGSSALDVACGAGRNAIYLASQGFEVTGVDISSTALERAAARAHSLNVAVSWRQLDLDTMPTLGGPYALVLMVRFVSAALLGALIEVALAPGGLLVVEEHLRTDAEVAGPQNPAFRVLPGELSAAASSLEILEQFEGVTTDPDGRQVALSQLVARRPMR